jgi:lipopolysaccharide transport system permease protein
MADKSASRDVEIVIDAQDCGGRFGLEELWTFRYLLYWLTWRDVKARYAETYVGIFWALLQPVALVAVFSFALGYLGRIPSDGEAPYALFVIGGIVVWSPFVAVATHVSNGLASNASLLSKVYCSRLAVLLSSAGAPALDSLYLFATCLAAVIVFAGTLSPTILLAPLFLFWSVLLGCCIGIWVAALSIHYRDVSLLLPIALQIGIFASPIVYPASLIPPELETWYAANPFVAIVAGMRWSLYGGAAPQMGAIAFGIGITAILGISGLYYFNKVQRSLVDRI